MKKNWLLLLILIGFSACQNKPENQSVVIKGQIKNAPVKQIILDNVQNKPVDTIFLDKQGNFADTLKLPEAYYKLNLGEQYAWLYLKPGFNLTVNTDYKDFDNQLIYKGEGAELNNYLAKRMLLGIALKPKKHYKHVGSLDEKGFVHLQDSISQLYDNLLKNVSDEKFKKLEQLRNTFEKSGLISQYEPMRRYINHQPDFKVSKNFPKAYQNIDVNNPSIAKIPEGKNMLISYLNYLYQQENPEIQSAPDPYDILKFANDTLKDAQLKSDLAYDNAKYNLMYTKHLDKFYQLFEQMSKDDKEKAEIKTKFDNIKAMSPGQPSPDFTAYDINGKEYHLKDFAGKPLYIDLWATWCSPCRAEIPFLDKLKELYKNKPVNFLSLDVYDQKDKWEQMVKQQKMNGWQLINTNRDMPFLKKYVVDGIPRFILLDKNGKIIDANAPRPSEKRLVSLLDKTLQEK